MSKINQKLFLEKIFLKDLFLEHINLLNEADPSAATTATDDKKPEQLEPQVGPIADEIAPFLQQIKTADSAMKKAENEFINAANNVRSKTQATDKQNSEVRSAAISSIENKLITGLTQNKNLYYKNLAARDSSMLTIINLLNARYEELTGGKKLPALNPNKILPGLMAAKAAGQSVPTVPSIGPSAAIGSVGTAAARSTSGTIKENRELLKELTSLILENIQTAEPTIQTAEPTIQTAEPTIQTAEPTIQTAKKSGEWDFEYFKKKIKSRDWEKKREAILYARNKLNELGFGSSRITFLLPNNKVLKIAYNSAGIAQNKQELEIFKNPSIAQKYINFIHEWDKGKNWLITERVEPYNKESFSEKIGITNELYESILKDIEKNKLKDLEELKQFYMKDIKNRKALNRILKGSEVMIENIQKKLDAINEIGKNKEKYSILIQLINLLQRGLLSADLHYSHFGKTANDEIKLYDYGYSDKVWKKFYRNR